MYYPSVIGRFPPQRVIDTESVPCHDVIICYIYLQMAPPEDDEHDEMVLYDTIKSFNMIKTMPESNFVWNPGFEDGLTDECSTYTPATPSCRSGPTYDLRWCPTQDYNYEASQGNSEWPAESPCRGSVPEYSTEDLNRGPVSPVTRLFQQLAGGDDTSPHQVTSQGTFLPKSNELDKKVSLSEIILAWLQCVSNGVTFFLH